MTASCMKKYFTTYMTTDNDDEEDLEIGEDALHIVVEEFRAGSKQESQGEAEYHLMVTNMMFMIIMMMLVVVMIVEG